MRWCWKTWRAISAMPYRGGGGEGEGSGLGARKWCAGRLRASVAIAAALAIAVIFREAGGCTLAPGFMVTQMTLATSCDSNKFRSEGEQYGGWRGE